MTGTRPAVTPPDLAERPRAGLGSPLAWAVASLSVLTVAPLLGWVYEVAAFHVLFLRVGLPAMLAVAIIGTRLAVTRPGASLSRALRVGAIAGLVGTVGYDLFRVPFVVLGGMRLLSPIESYGVLLADAAGSTSVTATLGWSYHVANGVLFGVGYAALAYRRHWTWGLAWALMLETATVVTPFADVYQLRGQLAPVVIAYVAHVPYGVAVGLLVQHGDAVAEWLDGYRRPVAVALGTVAVGLLLWLQPWVPTAATDAAADAVIVDGRLEPHFARVADGVCLTVTNADTHPYTLTTPSGPLRVADGGHVALCGSPGVHRIRTTGAPYDGGFLIVDALVEEVAR